MKLLALAALLSFGQARPGGELYSVDVKLAPAIVKVGEPTHLEVAFKVAGDAHISSEAPLTIKLQGPPPLKFERATLHYHDAVAPVGPAPHFDTTVTSETSGTESIQVALSFYVCTAELCDRRSEQRTLTLAVR